MSFFGKMFGGKKEVAPTTGEAIQKLRETENMLIKKQEFLEAKIEDELNIARKNASKNKRGMSAACLDEVLAAPIGRLDGPGRNDSLLCFCCGREALPTNQFPMLPANRTLNKTICISSPFSPAYHSMPGRVRTSLRT